MHKELSNELQLRREGPEQMVAPQDVVPALPASQPLIVAPIRSNMYERFRHM